MFQNLEMEKQYRKQKHLRNGKELVDMENLLGVILEMKHQMARFSESYITGMP